MSSLFEDPDDDVALPTRREAGEYDREGLRNDVASDHEFTLNTGIVLGIFFALAIVCALFFGLGYSVGHKSATTPAPVADASPTTTSDADTTASAAKPSATTSAPDIPAYVPSGGEAAKPSGATVKPAAAEAAKPETPKPPAPVERVPVPAPAPAPAAVTSAASAGGAGATYVQIAAVSHQEDADVLVAALNRRGYRVITRSDPNDKFIHVQIGPFTNRKDADATKTKLAADGYNAILK